MFETLRQKLADWIAPELKERRNNAERLMNVDELTDIANRRAYNFAEYRAEQDAKIFVMIDGDNFGLQNKINGYEAGDALIVKAAEAVTFIARKYGAGNRVFRIGGDEFVVIIEPGYEIIVSKIEQYFGTHKFSGINPKTGKYTEFVVSITGTFGKTLKEADEKLQVLKNKKKREYEKQNESRTISC